MPRSSTSSATSQSRRPTERSVKSASGASKSQKSVPHSKKKPTKSPIPSPPKAALPPAGGSLYAAEQDAILENLPPLPASIAASPAASIAPLSRETTISQRKSGHSDVGSLRSPPLPATVEETGGYQDRVAQPLSAEEDPSSSGLLPDETDDPRPPTGPSQILDPAEGALTYSPQQTHRSTANYSPALSRAGLTYAPTPHSAPAQYPYSIPHSPGYHHHHPHHRTYHAPGPVYPPSTGYPHYYQLPSAVSVPPSLIGHHPPYSPQYHPPEAAYSPTTRGPPTVVDMSASQLERQASGGSRMSTSQDAPAPPSPRGSTTSADRVPVAEGEGSDAGSRTDDPPELTQRIQNTMANMANLTSSLPDLHQLLTMYRETQGQLGLREELNRREEDQRADLLRQKDQRIDTLEKQLEGLVGKHSAETSRLRLAVGNLEEKEKELLDTIEKTETARAVLEIAKDGMTMRNSDLQKAAKKDKDEIKTLKEEVEGLKEDVKNAQEVVEKHQQELAELTEAMTQQRKAIEREIESSRRAAEEQAEVEKSTLQKTFEEQLHERDERIEGLRAELTQTSVQEKEAMQAEFDEDRTEWESRISTQQQEHEQAMGQERDRGQQERNELLRELQAERESLGKDREGWQQEREQLQRQFDEERDRLTQVWETKCSTLDTEHMQAKEALAQQMEALQGKLEDMKKEKDSLSQVNADLQGDWDKERAKSLELTTKLQNIAHNLGREKERLQKLVETTGEVADIRSKGDSF
ncbi:MAG: hypothetical protein M1823_001894 [Watsoniomyces obsoletus]|nr:MAG: hypothetical protein M1823_001894 [Watsoniomyces obsoletus]